MVSPGMAGLPHILHLPAPGALGGGGSLLIDLATVPGLATPTRGVAGGTPWRPGHRSARCRSSFLGPTSAPQWGHRTRSDGIVAFPDGTNGEVGHESQPFFVPSSQSR